MRWFVAGLLAGAGAVALAWWTTSRDGDEYAAYPPPPQRDAPSPPPRPPTETSQSAPAATSRSAARRRTETATTEPEAASFPAGEAVLRLGEGYVFGDPTVLRCPAGGVAAGLTLGVVGLPAEPKAVAALVADAPAELPAKSVALAARCTPQRPGVAFVQSAAGATYKVFALGTTWNADALLRAVRIGYVEIPRRAGGGVILLPTATSAVGAPTLSDLERIVAAGSAIPGASFTDQLNGPYERLSALPSELSLDERKYLLLDDPLATTIVFNRYSGLVASRGVAATGKVRIKSYTGVAVRGEMAGEIDVDSYAYVHVSGNLTGKLHVRSYATVVIDGDLLGEVDVSSYTTFLLRGRLAGKLSIRTSGSQFWFQQFLPRATAESLVAPGGSSNDLHLRESDCPVGSHDDVRGWKTVVVGEDAWRVIAR